MQVHRAQPRPVLHSPGRSAPRTKPRRPATTPWRAGVLALALAAWPASQSAMTTFLGDAPAAGGERPAVDSAPATASPRNRAVFVCQEGGVPVFTDRPCGPPDGSRTLTVETPAPGAAPITVPPRPRASTRPRPQPEGQAGSGRVVETRCTALRRQLDALDERMREGYGSREAARLWNRWRDLKSRLRAERC